MALEFKARDQALTIQTTELHRRLTDLNGEAERLRKMQAEYVPRETYYSEREKLAKDIEEIKAWKNNMAGRQAVIALVVSAGISLAFWILSRINGHP